MECPGIKGVNVGRAEKPGSDLSRTYGEDLAAITRWGFNSIRAVVQNDFLPSGWEQDYLPPEQLIYLDQLLEWCGQNRLRLILALDGNPCRPENGAIDMDEVSRITRFWAILAARYQGKNHGLCFDLLDGPDLLKDEDWNLLAGDITRQIRTKDQVHTIIIGSNRKAHPGSFGGLLPVEDANTLYSFHFFEPFFFTHQHVSCIPWQEYFPAEVHYPGRIENILKISLEHLEDAAFVKLAQEQDKFWSKQTLKDHLLPVLEFREKYAAQIFCGAWGASRHAPRFERLFWHKDVAELFKECGIPWAVQDYRSADFGLITQEDEAPEEFDGDLLKILTE
ncbi:MAG: glycoside hydrolase family 5 protein [Bacillota bacterium]